MKKVWNNADAVRDYRATSDAREGSELARALYRVFWDAHDRGEITPADMATVDALFDPVFDAVKEPVHVLRARENKQLSDLITSNVGLVRRIAKRELRSRASNDANLDEAVQEGTIGLLRAIREFDPSRGQFVSCAALWIRHHVQTCAYSQSDFVKARPARMGKAVAIAVNKFRLAHGREPEPEEVGVTRKEWDAWKDVALVLSVDDMGRPSDDGGGKEDTLSDAGDTPEQALLAFTLQRQIETVMRTMSPRNAEITRALFIDGATLEEVAEEHGVSITRVGQLKKTLEKRLREALVVQREGPAA